MVLWEPSEEELKESKLQTPDDESQHLRSIVVEPFLGKVLRPHQREGVRFVTECLLKQRDFEGSGVILADDMGLGKTLQSICTLYTLLTQGFTKDKPIVDKALVVCPTSLVSNWKNELGKWLKTRLSCIALTDSSQDAVIDGIHQFLTSSCPILIISYETFRRHVKRFGNGDAIGLIVCDEAHRLKNDQTLTYSTLFQLSCKRRILLSGTPMQNDLSEFFAMVNFTNPGVLGDRLQFRRYYELPILNGREPHATEKEIRVGIKRARELSSKVNLFILRRTNVLLSKHLPPKVIQIVCCRLTPLQQTLYNHFIGSKAVRTLVANGKKTVQVLPLICALKNLVNHPRLVRRVDACREGEGWGGGVIFIYAHVHVNAHVHMHVHTY